MMTEYVISEKLVEEIEEYLKDKPECISSRIPKAIRSHPLSEEIKNARDAVLDEISKKLMDAMGIQNPPLQHYDPDDSFIPSLGADELADIIKSLHGEQS